MSRNSIAEIFRCIFSMLMKRREFLSRSSKALLTTLFLGSFYENCKESGSSESSHSEFSTEHRGHSSSSGALDFHKYSKTRDSALACIQASQDCLTHCLIEMGKGDTSLKDCALSTRETMAVCKSFLELLSQESPFLKDIAGVCVKVCRRCADECEKHADHHEVCRLCRDSCLDCIREMKKLA